MFGIVATIAAASLLYGVVDGEMFRLANTVANFATVALIVWHQHHVRKQIEPTLNDAAAVVKRQLGERAPQGDDTPGDTDGYRGPERRKRKVE